jgi:hypothetical protein
MIHGVAGLGVFALNAIAAFLMARRFQRCGQTLWAVYSAATGLAVVALFIASTAVSVQDELGIFPNAPTGLLQRISIVIGFGWIAVVAWRLRRDRAPQRAAVSQGS